MRHFLAPRVLVALGVDTVHSELARAMAARVKQGAGSAFVPRCVAARTLSCQGEPHSEEVP
ncbi:UNVERIFIED_ORG: hypothetical protein M2179_003697 [Bradyrhizobium japonicum]